MLNRYLEALDQMSPYQRHGKVIQNIGMVIEATCPDTYIGEICEIHPRFGKNVVITEVVAVKEKKVLLMPYHRIKGISQGSIVTATGKMSVAKVGNKLLGRVIDAFGEPIDDLGALKEYSEYPLYREAINPLARARITEPMVTGIKAIDGFTTIGRGQRIGLFAGSGVGKSTLLASICRNVSEDINVIALIGERGREVEEFVNSVIGEEGMKKTVVICATAEQPPLIRAHAVYTAIAVAESFSEKGKNVLFTLDSVTRFAMALRELGLATGEPPTVKGYTASVFSEIPAIIERCGNFKGKGAISAIFSVLVEGDDFNDPVVDCVRAILDGHIVLTRELAEKAHYPAVDVLKSTSRLFHQLNDKSHIRYATHAKKIIANYFENKELIEMGALGSDSPKNAQLLQSWQDLEGYLQQNMTETVEQNESQQQLKNMVNTWGAFSL